MAAACCWVPRLIWLSAVMICCEALDSSWMVADSSSAVAPICSADARSTRPMRAASAIRASSCAAVWPCSSDLACSCTAVWASPAADDCSSAALATRVAPFCASVAARSACSASVRVCWLPSAISCMSSRRPSRTSTAPAPAFDSLTAASAACCRAAATSRTSTVWPWRASAPPASSSRRSRRARALRRRRPRSRGRDRRRGPPRSRHSAPGDWSGRRCG